MDYEVIVVGAGTTGSLIGYELGKKGHKVLIVEAGGADEFYFPFKLANDGGISYKPSFKIATDTLSSEYGDIRGFGFGGYGKVYYGWTYRFHPDDFRLYAKYGVGCDWPISYKDLMPYYAKAEILMGISGEFNPEFPGTEQSYPNPPFPISYATQVFNRKFKNYMEFTTAPQSRNSVFYDGRVKCRGYRTCNVCPVDARWTPLGTVLRKCYDYPTIEFMTRAPVVFVELGQNAEILRLKCMTTSGEISLKAKIYVIAANAIETPRILLNSSQPGAKKGIANSTGLVGKNYMGHPHMDWAFNINENVFGGRGPRHTSNCMKFINHPRRNKAAAFNIHYLRDNLPDITFDTDKWGAELINDVQHRADNYLSMGCCFEMLPDKKNYITLDKERDDLGLRTAIINYYMTDYTQEGVKLFKKYMRDVFKRVGITEYSNPCVHRDGGHWMGSTKMGFNKKDSVTDSFGRCWDHHNLFISGASLFPTSTPFNPIETSVALAYRTSEEIIRSLE